jgi:hypothetical protein
MNVFLNLIKHSFIKRSFIKLNSTSNIKHVIEITIFHAWNIEINNIEMVECMVFWHAR